MNGENIFAVSAVGRSRINPMLANDGCEADMDNDEYLMQIKFDGSRCVVFWDRSGNLLLQNRRHLDKTAYFPELSHSAFNEALDSRVNDVILDGEIMHENGFTSLLSREQLATPLARKLASKRSPLHFVAFDVIQINGENKENVPFDQRHQILSGILKHTDLVSHALCFENKKIFYDEIIKENEGVMLKRKNGLYVQRRSSDWLKIKKWSETEADIECWNENHEAWGSVKTNLGNVGLLKMENRDYYFKNKPKKLMVRYHEIMKSGKARFPIFVRFLE